jgi:hypothetical protein
LKPYQYYIDDILGAVYSPETADPDFLRDSAAMYAEACAEVNDRLRNVARLLNRGLRSEAIQLAEQEPNLLETFGLLDFPELPSWRQMLVNWGMAEPPSLLVELAGDLNRAYAEHQPIEALLRRHRLLALARAPLAARIMHLRRLIAADPDNDAWQTDLEALEGARIGQIEGDLKTAIRTNSLPHLTALYMETKNGDWSKPLPNGLAQRIEGYYRRAAAVVARQQLEVLDQQMNDSHMAFDVYRGREIREEWSKVLPVAMLAADDPLLLNSQPAFAWLADADQYDQKQQQFEVTVAQLERAVDDEVDADVLRRLYNTAQTFDEELPEVLKHRVQQRLATFELAVTRKRRLIIGIVSAMLVLILAVFGYWMVERSRQREIAEAVAGMQQHVDKSDHQAGLDYHDQLPEHLKTDPSVLGLKQKLDQLQQAEEKRKSDFADALERLNASPREAPDRQALAEAEKLMKLADELAAVDVIKAEIAEALLKLKQEQTEAFSAKLKTLREKLQQLELSKQSDVEKVSELTALRHDMVITKDDFPQANSGVLAQLDPLIVRVDALIASSKERIRQAEWLVRITESVSKDTYWRNVEQFASQFPNSAMASTISTLKQEKVLVEGLRAWDALLFNSFDDGRYVSAEEAQAILKAGKDLQKRHPNSPLEQFFVDRVEYLESAASRDPEKLEEIKRLLRDPLIANLYMVTRKSDGKAFYSRKPPSDVGKDVKVEFISGFDLGTKPRMIPLPDVDFRGEAPQTVCAKELQVLLAAIPDKGWESAFCAALQKASDSERKLDPILRMILLQRILETASAGSSPVAAAFKSYQQTLEQANVDLSVPWMAPDDELAGTERKRAEVLLSNLPPIAEAIQKTASEYRKLIAPYQGGYQWVGWLGPSSEGQWQCFTQPDFQGNGDAFIVCPEPGGKTAELIRIGKIQSGKLLDPMPLSASQKVAGRPVFIKSSSNVNN